MLSLNDAELPKVMFVCRQPGGFRRLMVREASNQPRKPIKKALQKGLRTLFTDIPLLVDQAGLERYIGLAPQHEHAETYHDRTQMLLRQRGTDGAGATYR
jgi:hypothetical protein